MTKSECRKRARTLFDTPYSKEVLFSALSVNIPFLESKVILSYKAIRGEIDLSHLEELYPEKTFLYPVVQGDEMYFTASAFFKTNLWGIEEPVGEEVYFENAVMLVPGLLFDKHCYRLGRGKGFYDRYIKKHKEKLYTIGLCKEYQLEDELPVDSYDQRLDSLIILPEMGGNHVLLT